MASIVDISIPRDFSPEPAAVAPAAVLAPLRTFTGAQQRFCVLLRDRPANNAYVQHLRTSLVALEEESHAGDSEQFGFVHIHTLFFHCAAMIEYTLKVLLPVDAPSGFLFTHDIECLLKQDLSEEDLSVLLSFSDFYLTGRYLSDAHGREAQMLRDLAQNPEHPRALIEEGQSHVLQVLDVLSRLLKTPAPLDFPVEPIVDSPTPAVLLDPVEEGVSKQFAGLQTFLDHLRKRSLSSMIKGSRDRDQRIPVFSNAIRYMRIYQVALQQLLTAARNPFAAFSRTNSLLLHSSLLLEQALLSLTASRDLAGESGGGHFLCQPKEIQGKRMRIHEHDLVQLALRAQGAEPSFKLTKPEQRAVADLRDFSQRTSRYLADENGAVAKQLKKLRQLSEWHSILETGFLTDPQERELRKFGQSEAIRKQNVRAAISKLQTEQIFPRVKLLFSAVEKVFRCLLAVDDSSVPLDDELDHKEFAPPAASDKA